jgi:surface carbohydrate biosynthesis protein
MGSQPKWLLLPIETKARELSSKGLLACAAAEKGWRVVTGDSVALRRRIAALPRGLFLDKSVAPSRASVFPFYRSLGHRVAAWCEEGLVFADEAEYLRRKISPAALGCVEAFFAWGEYQAGLVARHVPEEKARLVVSGNPRMDLLRRELRPLIEPGAARLRREFGAYVLINTNFSVCNHMTGDGASRIGLKAAGKVVTAEDEAFCNDRISHKRRIMQALMELLPVLATTFPDIRFIVRPHPSENHDTWRSCTGGHANMSVIYEGSSLPWNMGAVAVVHNSCTTGLEAYLLGRPVISYRPTRSDVHDSFLPNAVSMEAETPEQVTAVLRGLLAGNLSDAQSQSRRDVVGRYIASLDGPLAVDRIVSALDRIAPPAGGSVAATLRRILHRARTAMERPFWRKPQAAVDYHNQKFPGLSDEEMRQTIGAFAAATGRFTKVGSRPLAKDLHVVFARE